MKRTLKEPFKKKKTTKHIIIIAITLETSRTHFNYHKLNNDIPLVNTLSSTFAFIYK